eukprot:6947700-Prymnesium_polylepis.1
MWPTVDDLGWFEHLPKQGNTSRCNENHERPHYIDLFTSRFVYRTPRDFGPNPVMAACPLSAPASRRVVDTVLSWLMR